MIGILNWLALLGFSLYVPVYCRRLEEKIDANWVQQYEKEFGIPIRTEIENLDEALERLEKGERFVLGVLALTSAGFVVLLIIQSHGQLVFDGALLTSIVVPWVFFIKLLKRIAGDKRKRVLQVVENM
jgi:hypothetical protein